jgi:hypothetical protein
MPKAALRCCVCNSNAALKQTHIFSLALCKKCDHAYLLSTEENHDRFEKDALKKRKLSQSRQGVIENVFEFCYCPFWTAMELLPNATEFHIQLNFGRFEEFLQSQYFSAKSFEVFASRLRLPLSTKIDTVGIIELQKQSSLSSSKIS